MHGRWAFGETAIETVIDIDPFPFAVSDLFPDATLEAIAHERALLEPAHVDFARGEFLLAIRSFVLRMGGKTILIDSCVGEEKTRARPGWHQRRNTGFLDRLGVQPEAVDYVLCTHLHSDHVGWNTELRSGRWVPTFPNARYLIGADELAYWEETARAKPEVAAVAAYKDSVLPVVECGQVDTVRGGHGIIKGLAILPLPGHTPGQIGVTLQRADGRRAIFCGDAIHSPAQIFMPDWTTPFCIDREQAKATRKALIAGAVENGALLVPGHLRNAAGLRVTQRRGGFRPDFATME